MRRFFLALGVRGEDVPEPLPGVPEAVEGPADGVGRRLPAGPDGQGPGQQRDGPPGVRQAEVLRVPAEDGLQQVEPLVIQHAGPAGPRGVGQGGRVAGGGEGGRPVVHSLAGDPEEVGHLGGRPPAVEFEEGDGPAVHAGVGRPVPLAGQPPALGRGQAKSAHGRSS
jgi:hypothetical protein